MSFSVGLQFRDDVLLDINQLSRIVNCSKNFWEYSLTSEKTVRLRKTWMDNVREDLKEKNIDSTRIGEAPRNREFWRSLVRASSSVRWWKRGKKKEVRRQTQNYQCFFSTAGLLLFLLFCLIRDLLLSIILKSWYSYASYQELLSVDQPSVLIKFFQCHSGFTSHISLLSISHLLIPCKRNMYTLWKT